MKSPNIILVSLDSLRADHLPFYGYSRRTSPELTALLDNENTTLFENAYSTTAWTLPSHGSVFTGLYPSEHGVFDGSDEIDPEATLPAHLSDAGYETTALVNNGWLTSSGITEAFDTRTNIFEKTTPSNILERNLNRVKMLLSVTDSGAELTLEEFSRQYSDLSHPYFAFLHFMEPHYIYNPVRPHHQSYNQESTIRLLFEQRTIYRNRGAYYDGQTSLSEDTLECLKDLYDGEIRYLDKKLAELFEYLRERGDFGDSLIIIFGDHGELFGENNLIGHHFSLSDSLLRIPLIVKWPDQVQPITDSQVSAIVELSDLFKTILNVCSVKEETVPEERTLTKKYETNHSAAYAEYVTPNSLIESFKAQTSDGTMPDHLETNIRSLRRDNFKLVLAGDQTKLYDLESSEGEGHDVSTSSQSTVDEMEEEIKNYTGNIELNSSTSSAEFSNGVKKQLESLGYI